MPSLPVRTCDSISGYNFNKLRLVSHTLYESGELPKPGTLIVALQYPNIWHRSIGYLIFFVMLLI